MSTALTASEKALKKIFCDDYQLIVPEYQRPYSWTTEQVSVLLEDLKAAMERENKSPYFLGSVVIIKNGSPESQVVDGQQRLATLTMLFCVLRDAATDFKTRDNLHKYIGQEDDPIAGTSEEFRFSLRDRDRDFFRDYVQKPQSTRRLTDNESAQKNDTRRLIADNVQWLMTELGKMSEKSRSDLAAFIVQHCYLVVVSASDEDSAYRIFSVMNDRGLDLSPTDILKAKVVGKIPKNLRRRYADEWEVIESDLGREDFKELFTHIRMIFAQKKSHGTLQREFTESVLDKRKLVGEAVIEDLLRPYSDLYTRVSRPEYSAQGLDKEINEYLRHLGRLDNSDWIPPAMNAFQKMQRDEDRLTFVQRLERLAYMMFVLRMNINERINRYARILAVEDAASMLEDSSLQLTDDEKRRTRDALDGPIYELTRVRKPLLLRLDSLLKDGDVLYDFPTITVEHVLPQNPAVGSQWMTWFPNDEKRQEWTHRLANLVLLSRRRNSRASNYDFPKKKQEYFSHDGSAAFVLTNSVIVNTEWTEQVLEARQLDLLSRFRKEWQLD